MNTTWGCPTFSDILIIKHCELVEPELNESTELFYNKRTWFVLIID